MPGGIESVHRGRSHDARVVVAVGCSMSAREERMLVASVWRHSRPHSARARADFDKGTLRWKAVSGGPCIEIEILA